MMHESDISLFSEEPFTTSMSEDRLRFWATVPGWNPHEQAALLIGLDPISEIDGNTIYTQCSLIMHRLAIMKTLPNPCEPKYVLKWADANGLSYPILLASAIKHAKKKTKWERSYRRVRRKYHATKKEIVKGKERSSYELLILLMAINGYNYKSTPYNSTAGDLFDLSAKYDNQIISRDTIHDHLVTAAEKHAHKFSIGGEIVF